MSRYAAMFDRLRARGEGAFGAFVMLGDPDLDASADILDALVEAGTDMLEVGIPFSDPVADGPVIQGAATRALRRGVTPPDCLRLLTGFRARHPDVPVGILTYANLVMSYDHSQTMICVRPEPVEGRSLPGDVEDEVKGRPSTSSGRTGEGLAPFYQAAAAAGVDSVLVADVPSLEADPFVAAAVAARIDPVLIAAPNTPEHTLARIARLGQGYTYCVARTGVTGADRVIELDHGELFASLARHFAPPPVLGFGISNPNHVRAALRAGAAGVISGSAIVKLVEAGDHAAVRDFVSGMKAATASS